MRNEMERVRIWQPLYNDIKLTNKQTDVKIYVIVRIGSTE